MKFREISVLQIQRIQNSIKSKYDLSVPTYKMELPNGSAQIVEHDEDSIRDEKTPQVEVELWEKYQENLQKAQDEINEKTMAYIFYEGVECNIEEEWLDTQKWLGIDLPENKRDLKVMYITAELFKTPQQIKQAMFDIIKLSTKGADPEAVKAAEDYFRS